MTMAYWNGMTWGVSPQEIAFLDKLVTGYSYQTSTNADKEGESPTEDVGMKDMEISFPRRTAWKRARRTSEGR